MLLGGRRFGSMNITMVISITELTSISELTGIGDRSVSSQYCTRNKWIVVLVIQCDQIDVDIEVFNTCVHRCSLSLSLFMRHSSVATGRDNLDKSNLVEFLAVLLNLCNVISFRKPRMDCSCFIFRVSCIQFVGERYFKKPCHHGCCTPASIYNTIR